MDNRHCRTEICNDNENGNKVSDWTEVSTTRFCFGTSTFSFIRKFAGSIPADVIGIFH